MFMKTRNLAATGRGLQSWFWKTSREADFSWMCLRIKQIGAGEGGKNAPATQVRGNEITEKRCLCRCYRKQSQLGDSRPASQQPVARRTSAGGGYCLNLG